MHRRLKERLIGAAVLVMLAVIFIPMVLDDTSHTETEITESNIPERPANDFSSRIVPLDEPPQAQTEQGSVLPEPSPEVPAETDMEDSGVAGEREVIEQQQENREATTQDVGDVGLTAWVVQVGSFSSESNADALREKLQKAGFSAFVEPLKQDTRIYYRVRIGPELLRSNALTLKDRLKQQMDMQGDVLKYP